MPKKAKKSASKPNLTQISKEEATNQAEAAFELYVNLKTH